jgi:5-methylcytosine-specific restriction endonuclease McrA
MANGKVRGGSGAERNMPEYIAWRTAVFQRDNYTCQECGETVNVCAHHIMSWSRNPDLRFDSSNGVTLCEDCHAKKHPHLNFYRGEKKRSNTRTANATDKPTRKRRNHR